MPATNSGPSALLPLLDGSTAGELIPDCVPRTAVADRAGGCAVFGAERLERSDDRLGYRNGYWSRLSPPRPATSI